MAKKYPVGEWVVSDRVEGEEMRTIVCAVTEGALTVREQTVGDLTESLFGVERYVHSVRVSADLIAKVEEALGTTDLLEGLASFFDTAKKVLVDYEDLLDANGIEYRYRTSAGDTAHYRPSQA